MKIQTSGADLDIWQKKEVNNVLNGYRFDNHTELLEINLKTYEKQGKRQKWDVHIRASTDFGFFTAEGVEWKLNLAVKQALRKLEEQVESAKSKKIEHEVRE